MYVMLSIHKPHPEHEADLIDSMHRFGEAAKTQEGLIGIHTLKDEASGRVVGLALWESREAAKAAGPALGKAVMNDDFDIWEMTPIDGMRLEEV